MCGRYCSDLNLADVAKLYDLAMEGPPHWNFEPNYNVCPTQTVRVVIRGDGRRLLVPMRWGIIPHWWTKPLKEMKLATFNARADRIATAPMFRDSFKRRRCLMPVSGYYEWHRPDPTDKKQPPQPYYFTRRDGQVTTIAAIQDGWIDPSTGDILRSCAMVVHEPNALVGEVHDRMPVILEAKDFEQWERGDVKDAAALMRPAAEDVLQKWPVSKRINSSRTPGDDPDLIKPIALAA